MSIPLGVSNFSSATQQLIQTVKMSEINQTRNATWVHMINDHVIDYHDNCVMMMIIIKIMTKMKMVTMIKQGLILKVNPFAFEEDDDDSS